VRRIGGTGLGLSIALGDARAHGGTLTAAGAPGDGATFTLLLPVTPAPTRIGRPT
jgi:two-component system sensor histidine kinase MtrB